MASVVVPVTLIHPTSPPAKVLFALFVFQHNPAGRLPILSNFNELIVRFDPLRLYDLKVFKKDNLVDTAAPRMMHGSS
jgi:hypothetical protein